MFKLESKTEQSVAKAENYIGGEGGHRTDWEAETMHIFLVGEQMGWRSEHIP